MCMDCAVRRWGWPCVEDSVAGELGEPLLRIGLTTVIDRGDRLEPAARLLAPGRSQQGIGVGVPEPCGPRLELVAVERRALERNDGGVVLTSVAARAGDDDAELDLRRPLEPLDARIPGQGKRAVRTAEPTLAVRHHRQGAGVAGDPAGRAELG